jgi:hypothetical protein
VSLAQGVDSANELLARIKSRLTADIRPDDDIEAFELAPDDTVVARMRAGSYHDVGPVLLAATAILEEAGIGDAELNVVRPAVQPPAQV